MDFPLGKSNPRDKIMGALRGYPPLERVAANAVDARGRLPPQGGYYENYFAHNQGQGFGGRISGQ